MVSAVAIILSILNYNFDKAVSIEKKKNKNSNTILSKILFYLQIIKCLIKKNSTPTYLAYYKTNFFFQFKDIKK